MAGHNCSELSPVTLGQTLPEIQKPTSFMVTPHCSSISNLGLDFNLEFGNDLELDLDDFDLTLPDQPQPAENGPQHPDATQPSHLYPSECEVTWALSDEAWDRIQEYGDLMFLAWVLIHGENSVYNYLHILGSGHFVFYGKALRNLAIMSQQVTNPIYVLRHQNILEQNCTRQLKLFKGSTLLLWPIAHRGEGRLGKPKRERAK